jgi:hypothetical protein
MEGDCHEFCSCRLKTRELKGRMLAPVRELEIRRRKELEVLKREEMFW